MVVLVFRERPPLGFGPNSEPISALLSARSPLWSPVHTLGTPKEAGSTQCLVVIHQKFSTYWINTGAAPSKTLDNSCVNRFLNFVTTHHLQLLVSRVRSPAAAPRLDIHHHYDCVLSADQQSLERCGQKASILCDWGSSGGPTETCSLSRQLGCLSWFIVNKGLRSANAHIDLHGTEKSFLTRKKIALSTHPWRPHRCIIWQKDRSPI